MLQSAVVSWRWRLPVGPPPEVIEAYLRIYQEVLAEAWARCWRGASTGTRPGEGPERLRRPTSGYGVGRSLQGTSDWRAAP
jgi:hypothetical protein